jgi:hypothetical protein
VFVDESETDVGHGALPCCPESSFDSLSERSLGEPFKFRHLLSVAPTAIRREKRKTANLRTIGQDTSGVDELGEGVRLLPVFLGRNPD